MKLRPANGAFWRGPIVARFGREGKPDRIRKSRIFNYLGHVLGDWWDCIRHIRHISPTSNGPTVVLVERGGAMIATRPEKTSRPSSEFGRKRAPLASFRR